MLRHTPHTNPDKKTVIQPYQPHIHIYREGYGDKFAYPLPNVFQNVEDISSLFMDFLSYSRIINSNEIKVDIQGVLWNDSEI